MTKGRFKAVLIASILVTIAIPLSSFGQQGVELLPSEIRQVQTTQGIISCGLYESSWLPGVIAKDGKTFTAYAWQIRKLKRTLANTTDEAKRRKISKKISSLSKKKKVGTTACKESDGSPPPDTTPGPTPSPTPIGGSGCYNSNRDTACFGIPNGMLGNEGRGESLFEGICSGCHTDAQRRNRSYSQIKDAFDAVLAMRPFTSDLTAQDTADLVAYLNRYNPNQ